MDQTLAYSKNWFQFMHWQIEKATGGKRHPVLAKSGIIVFDVFSRMLPFGISWLHEEFHRATFSIRDIDSFNGVWEFKPAYGYSVKRLKDDDLIRFKKDHPAEFVRMSAAGDEGNDQLSMALEKDKFFNETKTWDYSFLWVNSFLRIAYFWGVSSTFGDEITDDLNEEAGTDMDERDFGGMDPLGWVYDLHRPYEPYEDRGVHPTGVGINRYRKTTDLTDEENDYLKLQSYLTTLNMIDPFLIGKDEFHGISPFNKKPMLWNAKLAHLLTPFGYTVDLHLFFKQDQHKVLFTLHNSFNHEGYHPGLDLRFLRYPLIIKDKRLYVNTRVSLWLQPEDLMFFSKSSKPGGLLSARIYYPINKRYEAYLKLSGKSEGWVAGNVYLEPNISSQVGLAINY